MFVCTLLSVHCTLFSVQYAISECAVRGVGSVTLLPAVGQLGGLQLQLNPELARPQLHPLMLTLSHSPP